MILSQPEGGTQMNENEEIKALEEVYIKAKNNLLQAYAEVKINLNKNIKKANQAIIPTNEYSHLDWAKLMNGALYQVISPSKEIPNVKKFRAMAKRLAKANNKHVQIKQVTKDTIYMQFTKLKNTDPSQPTNKKGENNGK